MGTRILGKQLSERRGIFGAHSFAQILGELDFKGMPVFFGDESAAGVRMAVGVTQIRLDVVDWGAVSEVGARYMYDAILEIYARWRLGDTASAWRTRPCGRCRQAEAAAPWGAICRHGSR